MQKYTLEQIENIIFNGFDYKLPDDVNKKICNLAHQVGSPDYVKTPVFKKRVNVLVKTESTTTNKPPITEQYNKKKRGNKYAEISDNWDSVKTFQTTKIENKTGIDADFDLIRSYINKITDKNYTDMYNKIFEVIDKLVTENIKTSLTAVGENIFQIASSNRYYSKIYAQLYCDLSSKFDFIREEYLQNFNKFIELFNIIEYVDPNIDYNKFCEINKINEKRKSLAAFYVNLMNYNVIHADEIKKITRNLLEKLYEYISVKNKKNEVDELTETISILYKKELYQNYNYEYEKIMGFTINEIIEKIAKSKVTDYNSLTNKSLFKFMDLIDM